MKFTNVFWKLAKAKERIIVSRGGSSSSKTYSTLQLLYLIANKHQGCIISIVSESLPHLKRGAMRDFFKILLDAGLYSEAYHNKSDNSYSIGKSLIEFFGADNASKMRGARRDYLFINECNNVSYETFNQLEIRTRKRIYLDYNPVSSFWVDDSVLMRDNVFFLQSTYRDNQFLEQSIIDAIEARKFSDPNWYKVYGMGEIGSNEGLVITNWGLVDSFPQDAKKQTIGLDFGYTNDPTACIKIGLYNGEIYVDELFYQTHLTNSEIINKLKQHSIQDEIFADSSEPKSIDEIYKSGFNIKPVIKGKDSILNGIDILKRYRINVTKNSLNLIKELRNYTWQQDKDGKWLNKPIDNYNHAIDALRYAAIMKYSSNESKSFIDYL